MRCLFLLKYRDNYGSDESYSSSGLSSGLLNSAKFVVEMLEHSEIECKLVQVMDGNDIDREVHQYKPTHAFIEALWVTPDKLAEVQKLHPTVNWIVRTHSEMSFLANEGIAIQWIKKYVTIPRTYVSPNSLSAFNDLQNLLGGSHPTGRVVYLPNYYPLTGDSPNPRKPVYGSIHVGCFGAVRPMKNQLIQAVAAIEYANGLNKKGKKVRLFFHINSNRNEQGGANVFKNLRELFKGTDHHLVEHYWMNHDDFVRVLRSMHVNMCVSFSETFCIVAADGVANNVPLVASSEIKWATMACKARPTSSRSIRKHLALALNERASRLIQIANERGLTSYNRASKKAWLRFLFLGGA